MLGVAIPLRASLGPLIVLVGALVFPQSASAQSAPSLIPSVGGGIVFYQDESFPTLNAMLEFDIARRGWHLSSFVSARGVAATCSEDCPSDAWAGGLGAVREIGAAFLGGGLGVVRDSGAFHLQPYGQVAVGAGRLRLQLRVEVPEGLGGVYLPLLIGVRLP